MSIPEFDKPDQEFVVGEEIYLIDKNKFDIWKAIIRKIKPNGYSVHYELTNEDKLYPTTKRFLHRTEINNEIFMRQEEERSKTEASIEKKNKEKKEKEAEKKKTKKSKDKPKPKPKTKSPTKPKKKKNKDEDAEEFEDDDEEIEMDINDDDESESSETADEDPSNEYGSQTNSSQETTRKRKKNSRAKKPIIDNRSIVLNAWSAGFREPGQFEKFMKENYDIAVADFDRLYKMHHIADYKLFKIGGIKNPIDTQKFWTQCQVFWKDLFGEVENVPTKDFLKKAAHFLKLPNQGEANARDALRFFFDPESSEYTYFVQFCAFLAMFGPRETVMRKVGQWFKCPQDLKDLLLFPDIPEIYDNQISDVSDLLNTDGSNDAAPDASNDAAPDTSNDTVADSTNEKNDSFSDVEMNCFTLKIEDGKNDEEGNKVYNIPNIGSDGSYLIDKNEKVYKDWAEYFELNNPKAKTT